MIKYRIFYDDTKYKKLYRSFSKKYPIYDDLNPNEKIVSNPLGCHDGQRKLLYSEIEFYTELSKSYNLNDILVVYIGSGTGYHFPIIFDLFPELDFFLCDPDKYSFTHNITNNKDRFFFYNNYYVDDSYKIILKWNQERKNKKIAFISDIRDESKEINVFNNMLSQQKWCMQLNSIAYLLKFRLPIIYKGFKYEYFDYLLPPEQNNNLLKISKKIKKFKKDGFRYLKGKIFIQIYAPLMSTESRLLHIRKSYEEPFDFDNYDIFKYNTNFYYFNLYDRYKRFIYKESKELKNNLLGFDDGYESVCEYYIIYNYIKEFRKEEPSLYNILKLIYNNVNNKLYQYYRNDTFILCSFKTVYIKINKYKNILLNYFNKLKLNIDEININTDKILILFSKKYYKDLFIKINQINNYYSVIINSLEEQKDKFKNGELLDTEYYIEQYNKAEYYIKHIKIFYKKIFILIDKMKEIEYLINSSLQLPLSNNSILTILKEKQNKNIDNYKKNIPETKSNYFNKFLYQNNDQQEEDKMKYFKKLITGKSISKRISISKNHSKL